MTSVEIRAVENNSEKTSGYVFVSLMTLGKELEVVRIAG